MTLSYPNTGYVTVSVEITCEEAQEGGVSVGKTVTSFGDEAEQTTVWLIPSGSETPAYIVMLTVGHDVACKVGYLDDGEYVAITTTAKGDVTGDGTISFADSTRTKAAYNKKTTLSW